MGKPCSAMLVVTTHLLKEDLLSRTFFLQILRARRTEAVRPDRACYLEAASKPARSCSQKQGTEEYHQDPCSGEYAAQDSEKEKDNQELPH